jgi:vacuolar-type H+-ATPase subunit H
MSDEPKNGEALKALQSIKETEEEAKNIIQNARENEAQMVIQDAYKAAEKIKEEMLTEAKKKAEILKNDIIKKAMDEAEEIRRSAALEEKKLRGTAEKNMTAAVKQASGKIKDLLKEGR